MGPVVTTFTSSGEIDRTAFAENMRDNPKLYNAYREWQVFYPTSAGTVRLPTGYNESQPIDAATYLADHPEDAAG